MIVRELEAAVGRLPLVVGEGLDLLDVDHLVVCPSTDPARTHSLSFRIIGKVDGTPIVVRARIDFEESLYGKEAENG